MISPKPKDRSVNPKERLPIMLSERLREPIRDLSSRLLSNPNRIANSLIEGCMRQINALATPDKPAEIVMSIRRTLMKDVAPLQQAFEALLAEVIVKDFNDRAPRWRALYFDEINKIRGKVTKERMTQCVSEADRRHNAGEFLADYQDGTNDSPLL